MLSPRKIPVLQILNGKLVKTERFKKPQYIGDPINAVRIFNEKHVDELIIIDISPDRAKKGPDFHLLEKLLSECQMPVGYGGGIRYSEDAHKIFHMGCEKLILNTLFFDHPHEVLKISNMYGAQAVSFSIDYRYSFFDKLKLYKNSGKKQARKSIKNLVQLIKDTACGELILHNIDNDGTFSGYDYKLLYALKDQTSLPIVLFSGAKTDDHFKEAVSRGAHSVAASSMFIYQGPHKAVLIQYGDR